jgi:cation:H+ antiporter
VAYTYSEVLQDGDEPEGELEPLMFQPKASIPSWTMTAVQTVLALAVIFAASRVFVGQLGAVGTWLGVPSTVVALLFSPVATELPEIMNAIIWIRQGKHRLALSNISGSMMVQATIPTALGLFFTPWRFDSALTIAAIVTAVAIAGLLGLLRRDALTPRRLAYFALGYALFVAGILISP